ncbi:MAG: hypothetical protein A3J93_00400 [Candidatus Magasanikbacteria bacterium RIFOXYC2_FULL_42_28]|uniref:Uncharacterized protein n=1 Tax=Candidatus Magasanikbacteria bacterium RIFOXYC2_FULL_42_28 TaxID=1798704 RepID=A0A1F6NWE9_9BACT|nr:MAG: hypothetical protein A3J93_00400 [Candidatus Magasanikbacteria bacterium RIFOXYC2_FULL_42_28]
MTDQEPREISEQELANFRMEIQAMKDFAAGKNKNITHIDPDQLSSKEYLMWQKMKSVVRQLRVMVDTADLSNSAALIVHMNTLVTAVSTVNGMKDGVGSFYAWVNNAITTPLALESFNLKEDSDKQEALDMVRDLESKLSI